MSRSISAVRRSVATLAAATTLVSLAALAPMAPADADASDYSATSAIGYQHSPPGDSQIWDVNLRLDPNTDDARAEIYLGRADGLRRGILTLGHTSGGHCVGDLQVVLDNSAGDDAVIEPAGSTPPPLTGQADGTDMDGSFTDNSSLADFVPTCANVQVSDGSGKVYDTAVVAVRHTNIHQLHLSAAVPVLQVPAQTASPLEVTADDAAYGFRSIAYDAQATLMAGDGLTVADATLPVTHNDDDLSTSVTNQPGLHDLTLGFSGGNVDSSTSTVRVYSPGGPTPPATGSLAGRSFASNGSSVSFLTKRWAYVGIPPAGTPTCTAAKVSHGDHGCEPYEWDQASNLLQIGDWIGAPDKVATGTHAVRGTYWHQDSYCQDWAAPRKGTRFTGGWERIYDLVRAGGDEDEDESVGVSFTKQGDFVAASESGGEYGGSDTVRGTYRVAAHGRLVLVTGKHHVHSLGTIGVALDASGRPDARGSGLEISLPGIYGIQGLFTQHHNGRPILTGHHASAADTWTPASFGGATCA